MQGAVDRVGGRLWPSSVGVAEPHRGIGTRWDTFPSTTNSATSTGAIPSVDGRSSVESKLVIIIIVVVVLITASGRSQQIVPLPLQRQLWCPRRCLWCRCK
ncbi:hypothetical protein CSPAE12_09668 [Colletotrichum incanum]|nr:hypothetical protein CSPAE12_09668 [Colletotrichum incanum]